MKTLAPLRICIAAVLAAVLLATMFLAGKRGVAEIIAQEPRFEFGRWQAGKIRPDATAASAMIAQLRRALALDPANPNLNSDIGRLEFWQVRSGYIGNQDVQTARRAALESFRRAALLRPTSGHSWANVALAKSSLGSVDAEYAEALRQSLRWAPWEPKLQLVAIELGLASWITLSEDLRQSIAQSIHRQAAWKLVDQKPALIRLLRRYGHTELGCPWAGSALACPPV